MEFSVVILGLRGDVRQPRELCVAEIGQVSDVELGPTMLIAY